MGNSFSQTTSYSSSRFATTPLTSSQLPVASLGTHCRIRFVTRTYCHLLIAVALFVGLQLLMVRIAYPLSPLRILGATPWSLLVAGIMLTGWVARNNAHLLRGQSAQYLALAATVGLVTSLLAPLVEILASNAPGLLRVLTFVTVIGFLSLHGIAFISVRYFAFDTALLMWWMVVALLFIVTGIVFDYGLHTWFAVGLIGIAGAVTLHDTIRILRNYPSDRYVAAALELFTALTLIFWHILRRMSPR